MRCRHCGSIRNCYAWAFGRQSGQMKIDAAAAVGIEGIPASSELEKLDGVSIADLDEEAKACVFSSVRSIEIALMDACVENGCGNVGGGCAHVIGRYQGNLFLAAFEGWRASKI